MVQSFPLTAFGVSRVRSRPSSYPIIVLPLLPNGPVEEKKKIQKKTRKEREGKSPKWGAPEWTLASAPELLKNGTSTHHGAGHDHPTARQRDRGMT